MKEQSNRYEKFGLVYPIALVIMAILMIVKGIMEKSTLCFVLFIFCTITAIMFFYLVKNHHFKKTNVGHVVGSVIMLIGIVLIDGLMTFSCQIPDFAMKLVWVGFGIVMISIFYDIRMKKR